ncbi:hypothetical protein CHUAL_000585 [Chamberlinius hualienensis]
MWAIIGNVTNFATVTPVMVVTQVKRRNTRYAVTLLVIYLLLLGLLAQNLADVVHTDRGLLIATQSSSVSESELSYMADVTLQPRSDHYHHQGDHSSPSFYNDTSTNVTAQLATIAYLNCRVQHLGDKVVSWVRRRDFHILTVGLYTYTSDQRFQVLHKDESEDWTLQIKYTQSRDAGVYECQVSSDPPVGQFFTLNVVVASANILGLPDLYFKSGSTITLTCVISQSPDPPMYVFWYHDSRMINYDTSRGGITVNTIKGDTSVSTLTISDAQKSDSGNYTCNPANAEPTSVTVHVLNGEKPAAIQHDAKTSSGPTNIAIALGSGCISQNLMFGCVLLVSVKILFCCCCSR